MAIILNQPTDNNLQYTLNTGYTAGGTTLVLSSSVASVVQAPGVCVVDRVDASGNKTPTAREYFTFTGVSTNTLTGVSGGQGGSTNQNHNVGAIVEFVPDVTWANSIYNTFTQEHTITGQHASLASVTHITTGNLVTLSQASVRQSNVVNINIASSASANLLGSNLLGVGSLATIRQLYVTNLLNVSGASIIGLPSSASGAVLTSVDPNGYVFSNPATGTGGLNISLQVPGGLASIANTMGRVVVPTAFTGQNISGYLITPASVASVWVQINKNGSIYGVIGWLAGATYASSASIATAALAAGDFIEGDIRSTASLAADLSITLRAT